ncbi:MULTISPECIES: phage tail tip lysozyme [Arthrobacter]|uniref:Phage tail lysozyme domain-containing protein n=1 Tax=Arthrobacter terricola TaxID=2547396 RepID=A0A4R5K925_9MICC|nr:MULTISPECIES: phage tail tip lysozyme [Arthrobacter]MBT8163354.1 hypothetical protein [Arthrobacter sp. GN70]TDF90553.1 hypothetical protein E1809_22095 [Arthrobacter terricola]
MADLQDPVNAAGVKKVAAAAVQGAGEGAMKGGAAGAAAGATMTGGLEAARQLAANKDDVREKSGPHTCDTTAHRLGAGGTSFERTPDAHGAAGAGNEFGGGKPAGDPGRKIAAAGAAAAAPPASGLLLLILFLQWLKSLFFALLGYLLSFLAMMLQWAFSLGAAIVNAVKAPFAAIGAGIAKGVAFITGGSVALSATAATVTGAAVSGVTVFSLLGGLIGVVSTSIAANDDPLAGTCGAVNVSTVSSGPDTGPATPDSEKNAREVWSVLKRQGMPDENIAGILGNWTQESGIDPGSVQGFPAGMALMTDAKKAAAQNTDNGIGLGQWTGARNTLLRNYARARNTDWWNLGLQLAFMADPHGDSAGDVTVFTSMISTSQGTPAAAARYFHDSWERSADDAAGVARRGAMAEQWYATMSGWHLNGTTVDSTVGDFVSGAARTVGALFTPGSCTDTNGTATTTITPTSGGMSEEQARQLIDLYNREGDKFLDARYGDQGGPGSCGSNHAENCVSFSTYWLNKYTTFQAFPGGDGIRTAYAVAEQTGKQMSPTPTPYSVGSGPGTGDAGHTLVVLGVQGDKVILGEAGYCAFMGRVRIDSAARMRSQGWMFVPMQDALLPNGQATAR